MPVTNSSNQLGVKYYHLIASCRTLGNGLGKILNDSPKINWGYQIGPMVEPYNEIFIVWFFVQYCLIVCFSEVINITMLNIWWFLKRIMVKPKYSSCLLTLFTRKQKMK